MSWTYRLATGRGDGKQLDSKFLESRASFCASIRRNCKSFEQAHMALTFARMWTLIERTFDFSRYLRENYRRTLLPSELLIAVFWEESVFENKRGVGNAIGFGQVQPGTLDAVNDFWQKQDGGPMTFVASQVLRDHVQSIQLAGLAMAMLYEKQLKAGQPAGEKSLRVALHNYAGGSSEEKEQAPKNAATARSWFDCRDALLPLHISDGDLILPTQEFADRIMKALNKTTRQLGNPGRGGDANWIKHRRMLFPLLQP
jgi:hypothetical protein